MLIYNLKLQVEITSSTSIKEIVWFEGKIILMVVLPERVICLINYSNSDFYKFSNANFFFFNNTDVCHYISCDISSCSSADIYSSCGGVCSGDVC